MDSTQNQNIPTPVVIVQQNGQNVAIPVQTLNQNSQNNNLPVVVQGIPLENTVAQPFYPINQRPLQSFEVYSQSHEETIESIIDNVRNNSVYSAMGSVLMTIIFSIVVSYYFIFTILFCGIQVVVGRKIQSQDRLDYRKAYFLYIASYSLTVIEVLFINNVVIYIIFIRLSIMNVVLVFVAVVMIIIIESAPNYLAKYCAKVLPRINIIEN